MRKMALFEWLLLAALVLAAVWSAFSPLKPQMLLYPLIRQAAQAKMNYATRDMAVIETEHLVIKYLPQDAAAVALVTQGAEQAYGPVTRVMGYSPGGKTLIVVYPDRTSLNRTFGWAGDQSAMGVYWGGVIQVLSPRSWFEGTAAEFARSGPMVHEYTPLVFDHQTRGNYPRWYTEGLAQYLDYKVNGYEWRTATNSLCGQLYTMAQLENDFDCLPDQSLAYRESLAAVRYIAVAGGEDALRQVAVALGAGRSIQEAVTAVLGVDYAAYTAAWQQWARINMG